MILFSCVSLGSLPLFVASLIIAPIGCSRCRQTSPMELASQHHLKGSRSRTLQGYSPLSRSGSARRLCRHLIGYPHGSDNTRIPRDGAQRDCQQGHETRGAVGYRTLPRQRRPCHSNMTGRVQVDWTLKHGVMRMKGSKATFGLQLSPRRGRAEQRCRSRGEVWRSPESRRRRIRLLVSSTGPGRRQSNE